VRFAAPIWLFGMLAALAVGIALVAGAFLLLRTMRRFGDEERVGALVTGSTRVRRTVKGLLLVFGVALAFVAASQPQYGRGTRVVPATNLDVVIALDYSKSMYARDIAPSRSMRAKTEVARLISDLPGARFAAVAFAGEPMTFPLTSDGAAIAQFFRQLTPNDMPVGGTSLAKALEAARSLLDRDPISKRHARVIVLVTDGEDLGGDPVEVAKEAHQDGIIIDVVQIGGRTPEPVPDVDDSGKVVGVREGRDGKPLMTSLSAKGEAQLADIAKSADGTVVRSATGTTGIDEIARRLSHWMTEELSEKVVSVFADVYMYPLGAAILLLLVEGLLGESRKQPLPATPPRIPRRPSKNDRRDRKRLGTAALLGLSLSALCGLLSSCDRKPADPFMRHAPTVDEALGVLDAGDAGAATSMLETYLSTGRCSGGNIGTPDSLSARPQATFDLGLALFRVAESYGGRFGEEPQANQAAPGADQQQLAQRSEQIDCALRVVATIAQKSDLATELRARAEYLTGNLHFLRQEWKEAVAAYDRSLQLVPGLAPDAGERVGSDAAWNRALALAREQQEPPDAGPPDAGNDAGNDAGKDASDDAGSQPPDAGKDAGDDAGSQPPDAGKDAGNNGGNDAEPDGGRDAGAPYPQGKDAGQPPQKPPSDDQGERVLDMLEETPTLQEHVAKEQSQRGAQPGMEDK